MPKKSTYSVKGMHCASCQVIIENQLLKLKGVKSADVSASSGLAVIRYTGQKPSLSQLNRLFQKSGYVFSSQTSSSKTSPNPLIIIAPLVIIGIFLLLNQAGLSSLVSVNQSSALPLFVIFGLLAGFSTCSALVGGIILSMSRQWQSSNSSASLTPHLLFNFGRLISYALLGALLGFFGQSFQLSPLLSSLMTIAVSLLMVYLALQMLGLKAFQKFHFSLPKSITRAISHKSNLTGKWMPLVLGALTFFLPCGFTLTAQALALGSGDPLRGSLIMSLFALGTLPSLLLIGFSSVRFAQKPQSSANFLKIAGVLVLFFALFNINSSLNVFGVKTVSDLAPKANPSPSVSNLPAVIGGFQILKMSASASGYSPKKLVVKSGIPVRWEITDKGTNGCTNAIISRSLFPGQIPLTPGKVSVKEFTPPAPGIYKFSCWMGMVSGTIEVVK